METSDSENSSASERSTSGSDSESYLNVDVSFYKFDDEYDFCKWKTSLSREIAETDPGEAFSSWFRLKRPKSNSRLLAFSTSEDDHLTSKLEAKAARGRTFVRATSSQPERKR